MMQELSAWQAKGFTPTQTTYTRIIQHHLRKGNFEAALRVCEEMKQLAQDDPTQLKDFFLARMLVHSERGDVAACTQELAEMDARDITRSDVVYLRLVEAHVRAGDLTGARSALTEMLTGGYVKDAEAHCALLTAYAQKRDVDACAQLAEEMRAHKLRPNAAAYTQWIDALCAAQDIGGALRALDEMKEVERKIPLSLWAKVVEAGWKGEIKRGQIYEKVKGSGFSPSTVYSVVMDMEEKKENWEKILDLAHDLRQRGGVMDREMYEKVAMAHQKRGHAEMSWRVIKEAKALGYSLPLSSSLFFSLSARFDAYTCAQMVEIMKEGRKEGEKVDRRVYETLAEMWVKANNVQNAQKVIEEIKREGGLPSMEILAKMIDEAFKCKKWDLCINFFKEIQKNTANPPQHILEVMVEVYGVKKDAREAKRLWEGSKKGEISNSMVFAFSNSGDAKSAIELFREMQRKGIRVNENGYSAIIALYGKKGDLREVERLYEEVLEKKVEHGEKLNNAVLTAFTISGGKDKLVELLRKHENMSEVQKFMNVLKSLKIVT